MLIQSIDKKEIAKLVAKSIKDAHSEIVATMLLREEILNPLPSSYHTLLKKKTEQGIQFKRLGFGIKKDYVTIRRRIGLVNKNYIFKCNKDNSLYQRMIIIDRSKLFFGVENSFYFSIHKPLIMVFLQYFSAFFQKGEL